MNLHRKIASSIFTILGLALLHCGGQTTSATDPSCAPIPCPSGAPWDQASCACVAPKSGDGGVHGVPDKHQPTPTSCSMTRAPGIVDAGAPDSGRPYDNCEVDADCTQGKNGRCGEAGGLRVGKVCSYDVCFADADCASGESCTCAASGNSCVKSNCRIDSDCGANGYCSPTAIGSCNGNDVGGIYCHTPTDECANDADCNSNPNDGQKKCEWAPASNNWTCQQDTACPG